MTPDQGHALWLGTIADIKASCERDGRRLSKLRLETAIADREIPRPRRKPNLADVVATILPAAAPELPELQQLRQLDHQLTALLAAAAPSTWADTRTAVVRVLRRARAEIRARDRRGACLSPAAAPGGSTP